MALVLSHHTRFSVVASRTMYLSEGERPVYLPVSATNAPSAVNCPSPRAIAASTRTGAASLSRRVLAFAATEAARLGDVIVLMNSKPGFNCSALCEMWPTPLAFKAGRTMFCGVTIVPGNGQRPSGNRSYDVRLEQKWRPALGCAE